MSGTLTIPVVKERRQRTSSSAPAMRKPIIECDLCYRVLERSTCQRGMRNVRVLFDLTSSTDSSIETYYVVQVQSYDGRPYAYTVVATIDKSEWPAAMETAFALAVHLEAPHV